MKKEQQQKPDRQIWEGWHKIGGEKIEDVEKYIYDQLASRSDMEIYIGTDSLLKSLSKNKKIVTYLSVIVFRKGRNGCHVIKRRDEETKHHFVSTSEKLNGEINRTSELALWLREKGVNPEVHLDINTSPKYNSFEIYKYIKGYFEGLQFKVKYKDPDGGECFSASFCADYFI